jgi:hypothetical protein
MDAILIRYFTYITKRCILQEDLNKNSSVVSCLQQFDKLPGNEAWGKINPGRIVNSKKEFGSPIPYHRCLNYSRRE